MLTAIAQVGYKYQTTRKGITKRRALWKCRCDCGKFVEVTSLSLATKNTRSCGCLKTVSITAMNRHKRKPPGHSAKHGLWLRYQQGAQARGYCWELGKEEFLALAAGDCYYCGDPPCRLVCSGKYSKCLTNGVDRKNNSLGYTKENCVSCCTKCNVGKMDTDAEDWVAHCRKVMAYQDSKKTLIK